MKRSRVSNRLALRPLYSTLGVPSCPHCQDLTKIEEPTIAIGQLVTSRSILVEREYEFQSFVGKQRIESRFFPDLEITVEEIIGYGHGI